MQPKLLPLDLRALLARASATPAQRPRRYAREGPTAVLRALKMAASAAHLEIQLRGAAEGVRVDELGAAWEAEARSSGVSLLDRVRGASLVFSGARAAPEKSAAQARRRAELTRRGEHRAYAKLVRSVHTPPVRPEERMAASLRHQFTISANMVVAPLASAGICYVLSRHIVSEKNRVVVALLGGIGMLFIEMVLFILRTYSVEHHVARKKRKEAWDARWKTKLQ